MVKNEAYVDAKYVLKNVLEHTSDTLIIAEVNKRLDKIKAIEEAALKPVEKEDVFIDLGNNENVSEELFDVEEEKDEEPLDSLKFETTAPADSLKQK